MPTTFKGGVHPQESKHHTEHKPIEKLPAPEKVFVLLSQHTGAPAKPIVRKGDAVKLGQKIAEAGGFISANLHSPVSGKVAGIVDVPHFSGKFGPAIAIENDGQDTPANELEPVPNWQEQPVEFFPKRAMDAGIVGMGGAMFPTAVKLSPPKDKIIDTVIINGGECEPYLTADHRLMLEYPEHIVEGATMIAQTLGAQNIFIGIEDNKQDAIVTMKKYADGQGIKVVALKTKYPQGAEKQLIKALVDREVPSGGLPFDVGCYVQNVGTAKALRDAVVEGRPLYERVVTVSGSAVNEPKNLLVRVGTPISELLEAVGGPKSEIGKVIMGGPMMGLAQWSLDVPITKGTSGVLFFPPEQAKQDEETPCILCANCVSVCPMRLVPTYIVKVSKAENFDMASQLGALDCIECGSCAFVCPANIRLLHYIRFAKAEIRKKPKQ